jgi:uncharacterized membrane protein
MDMMFNIGLGMVGFLLGTFLFSNVGLWIHRLAEFWKEGDAVLAMAGRMASVSLLHSGPWFAVILGVFVYYTHEKVWAQPILVGIATSVAVFSVYLIYLSWRGQRAQRVR